MKLSLTSVCVLLGLSISLVPTIASAQYNDPYSNNNGNDPFKRAASGDTSGLLNLINQAQINSKINPNYGNQQQEQIKSATDDFRVRQLQVLREQSKKNTPAPVATPNN